MANVNPSYVQVAASGIAAGDDAPADSLASYDQVKYSGISTTSQADGLAAPSPTPEWKGQYPSMQDPGASGVPGMGADTTPHGVGPKAVATGGLPTATGATSGGIPVPDPIPTPVHKQAAKP